MQKTISLVAAATLSVLPCIGSANNHASPENADNSSLETITITVEHQPHSLSIQTAEPQIINPDPASWLNSIAGAAINKNGPISGIAQYRGLYGDRVAVTIDNHQVIGSGSNAMDTPMSYSPNIMVDSMTVYRGIAPVSASINSLGSAVKIDLKQAEISHSKKPVISGELQAGYAEDGHATATAAVVNIAASKQALLLFVDTHQADHEETAADEPIIPSQYGKQQFGFDYEYEFGHHRLGLSYQHTKTTDAGTPSLPMDIKFIDGDRVGLMGVHNLSHWHINWQLGYMQSDHQMDNVSQRQNTPTMQQRINTVDADSIDFKLTGKTDLLFADLLLGIDGYHAEHKSVITSPNNEQFEINNFNQVEDIQFGVFAELEAQNLNLGLRLKQVYSDAGEVSHFMKTNNQAQSLLSEFNNNERETSDILFDLAINWNKPLSDSTSFSIGGGVKQKAPAYQQRYLWLPMQSTGGLADGHNYIGNINLKSETAYQLNLGYRYKGTNLQFSPNVFYQYIDNYIQATPSNNTTANELANNMMQQAPMQFSNVGARLFGTDLTSTYQINEQLQLIGIGSIVYGERTDIEDNLYRISAPNIKLNARYSLNNWLVNFEWQGFAKQNRTSDTNNERQTSGYGIANIHVTYFYQHALLEFGVENLLNKEYHSHLAGLYRVTNKSLPHEEKIHGEGRNFFMKFDIEF